MNRAQPVALVASGRIKQSFLARLPGLSAFLGPVKSSSVRLASRLSNSIGAGSPTARFEDLANCRTVLVCVPPARLPETVEAMASAPLNWRTKTVVLCDGKLDSSYLRSLAAMGAFTASAGPVEGLGEDRLLVEGSPEAIKVLKKLFPGRPRLVEIREGMKPLYTAGLSFASELVLPLATAAVECLLAAGLTSQQAEAVAAKSLELSWRAYLKAGRKGWQGDLAEGDSGRVSRQLHVLRESQPLLADYYLESARQALRLFGRNPGWLDEAANISRKT